MTSYARTDTAHLTTYADHPERDDVPEVRLDIVAVYHAPVRGVWSEQVGCVVAPEPGGVDIDELRRDGVDVELGELTAWERRAVEMAVADPRGHRAGA